MKLSVALRMAAFAVPAAAKQLRSAPGRGAEAGPLPLPACDYEAEKLCYDEWDGIPFCSPLEKECPARFCHHAGWEIKYCKSLEGVAFTCIPEEALCCDNVWDICGRIEDPDSCDRLEHGCGQCEELTENDPDGIKWVWCNEWCQPEEVVCCDEPHIEDTCFNWDAKTLDEVVTCRPWDEGCPCTAQPRQDSAWGCPFPTCYDVPEDGCPLSEAGGSDVPNHNYVSWLAGAHGAPKGNARFHDIKAKLQDQIALVGMHPAISKKDARRPE